MEHGGYEKHVASANNLTGETTEINAVQNLTNPEHTETKKKLL
jgi:hypothetical protein